MNNESQNDPNGEHANSADAQPSSIGDANVAHLLQHAYQPDPVDAGFTARVTDAVCKAARARGQSETTRDGMTKPRTPRVARWLGAAAMLTMVLGLGWNAWRHFSQKAAQPVQVVTEPTKQSSDVPSMPSAAPTRSPMEYIAAQPVPSVKPEPALAIGQSISTGRDERRRVTLTDSSVLYLDEGTTVQLTASRRLSIAKGRVYVEVASMPQRNGEGNGQTAFVVATPDRQVTAMGTRFAVAVGDAIADDKAAGTGTSETSVLVTQGKVRVAGVSDPIEAGQQWASTEGKTQPAPRAAHSLAWTRQLMAAADAALVPASAYAGGALVVIDDAGREHRLSLRRYHVDVHIEDGFARTTIDQTYFNHEHARIEGTFIFPLPADASISRLAMYVGRRLMEGGMVEQSRARDIFEEIRYARRDPALLEWIDGTTFKMRVFPIEPRDDKRIILCYTQKLDTSYGSATYRFPAGHTSDASAGDSASSGDGQRPASAALWSFRILLRDGEKFNVSSPSHDLTTTMQGHDLVLASAKHDTTLDRDIVLNLKAKASPEPGSARLATDLHEGQRYLMLRYQPDLPREAAIPLRHWVFLLETSADRDPLLARAQIRIMRTLLENANHDDTFSVLTANTKTTAWRDAPQPATQDNLKAAVAFAEHAHLIGALDLERALKAATANDSKHNRVLVHLGSATPVLGLRDQGKLLELIPADMAYVGVMVGRRGSRSWMDQAAARTGGYVAQINPDEPVAWRAFELFSTLNAPRLLDVQVRLDGQKELAVLPFDHSLVHGQELCAVTRVDASVFGAEIPTRFTITGRLNGQPFERKVEAKQVTYHAGYLPRSWARLELDRLVASPPSGDDSKVADAHRERIVKLSQAMHVMSPYTSLLVLENDAMYEQYKVDRGRRENWAPYNVPVLLEEPAIAPTPTQVQSTSTTQDENDPFLQARRLVAQEKFVEGQEAEAKRLYRSAVKLYSDALALDPENVTYKAALSAARAKADSPFEPRDLAGSVGSEIEIGTQAAVAEYEELMAKADQLASAKNYNAAMDAVQQAKVRIDQARNVLGATKYTELRNRANDHLAAVNTANLAANGQDFNMQAKQDAADAESRRLTSKVEQLGAVQRLLRRAADLRKEQDYERSIQLINQALFLDPGNPAAEAMKMMVEDSRIAVRSRSYLRERSLRIGRHTAEVLEPANPFLDAQRGEFIRRPPQEQEDRLWPGLADPEPRDSRIARRQAEMIEATIPYSELITYPSDWPQLTAMRLGAFDGDAGDSQVNRRVKLRLQDPIPLNFENNKLVNVIDYFRNTTGVNFFVNWAALEEAGIEQDALVNIQLNNVPAEQGLRLVLHQVATNTADLKQGNAPRFSIIDGVVHISTLRDLQRTTDVRVYDIRDLIAMDGRGEASAVLSREDFIDHVTTLIMDIVGTRDEWADRGGEVSSMRELNGNLIVKTTPENHLSIVHLLSQLRLTWGLRAPAGGESPWDSASAFAKVSDAATGSEPRPSPQEEQRRQLALAMAAARYYLAVEQVDEAEAALRPHLQQQLAWSNDRINTDLFRLGAALAYGRGAMDRVVAYFERAVEADYARLGDTVLLEPFREDYHRLLIAYISVADGLAKVDAKAVKPMAAKIVRTADRWRSIDPEADTACALAARALHRLGEHELAWAYETTPLAGRGHDATAWGRLARSLIAEERWDDAARSFAAAFDAESTNPQWLLEHAQLLLRLERHAEAERFLQQIIEGQWQTRFRGVVQEAEGIKRRPQSK